MNHPLLISLYIFIGIVIPPIITCILYTFINSKSQAKTIGKAFEEMVKDSDSFAVFFITPIFSLIIMIGTVLAFIFLLIGKIKIRK